MRGILPTVFGTTPLVNKDKGGEYEQREEASAEGTDGADGEASSVDDGVPYKED